MKTQARLRLRHVPRHRRRDDDRKPWPEWVHRLGIFNVLCAAFERNVWPRHYVNDEPPLAYQQMDNYLTGQWSWHGSMILHSIAAFDPECENPVIVRLR